MPGEVRSPAEFEKNLYAPAGRFHGAVSFADDELMVDPLRFAISPRQAKYTDPQHLLALEAAHNAFADAGLGIEELRGSRTGVYVGMTESDYLSGVDVSSIPAANLSSAGIGSNRGAAAGRISYYFDLHGPSMQLDSTCSSGLLALHIASAALRDGEIDRALVIASHLVRSEQGRLLRAATGALSPSSACEAFTEDADGFVPGEGVVAFVLEASPARAGVYAQVCSAANHDGRTSGLTVPNRQAQQDVIERARERTGADGGGCPVYVEGHGTGTRVGDPIEVSALAAAYGTRERGDPLLIGSNKARFGHLEAASGLLSLLVAVLVFRTSMIPGTRSQGPTNHIDWGAENVRLVREDTPLPDHHAALLGVSAFGMSGTNVHALVAPADSHGKVS